MADTHKPRRGGPPDPVEAVRSHRIVSYLTNAEFRAPSLVADREGQSLSAVVKEDPAELRDLSTQHPQKRNELMDQWEQYEKDNGVLDLSPESPSE
jgi:hypothetical protein